jgi:Fe-S cluster biogenesis protein NfuA
MSSMASKKVAVIIGRFSTPTEGHYQLINSVRKFIKENKDLGLEVTPVICIIGGSKSDKDIHKNPLTVREREAYMQASGKCNGCKFFTTTNAFKALSMLRDNGYEPIAIAAGEDRIDPYMNILDKYFKKPDGSSIHHYPIKLNRDKLAVNPSEESMDDALKSGDVEVDMISGSLARRAVELGYFEEFCKIVGLEDKPKLARKMFDKIKYVIGGE